MPACPSEEVILALAEDRLGPEQRASTEAHVDGCERCEALLSAARASRVAERRSSAATASEPPPFARGDRIGPYLVVAHAGRGAMGEVYRARDERLGRDVAVKALPARFADDPDRLTRFRHESRAAGTLSHHHLLTVLDVETHDGVPYLVTEWLTGTTLRERLLEGALPREQVLRLGVELARGLAAAHDRGVVHRALEPANVFLCADGACRILDFGLARLAEGDGEPGRPPERGAFPGRPGYAAPEQIRGLPVDHRADLFALGAVLHEAATGRPAFGAGGDVERMRAALRDEPPPLAGELGAVVARCLAKRPADRFQSAHDLAFVLELVRHHLDGLSLTR
jgi:serine/threonine protein kinase